MLCGVASLAMLCSLHGRVPDIAALEELCAPTMQGVSLMGIIKAAESLGLKATGVRASTESLVEHGQPAILHWNQNHFVLLVSVNRRGTRFRIADPAKGVMTLGRGEFERHWLSTGSGNAARGVALLCEPTETFYAAKREEEALRRTHTRKNPFRFLMQYMGAYKRHFAAIALALGAASLMQLVLPFLTQAIVDLGIAHRDISLIWLILLGELLIGVRAHPHQFHQEPPVAAHIHAHKHLAGLRLFHKAAAAADGLFRHQAVRGSDAAHG